MTSPVGYPVRIPSTVSVHGVVVAGQGWEPQPLGAGRLSQTTEPRARAGGLEGMYRSSLDA
eukprot:7221017-Pyramimonas_sp.AAC.1